MIQDNVVDTENITKFLSCILKKVVEYAIIVMVIPQRNILIEKWSI